MKKIEITPQELCERLSKGESFYNSIGARLHYEKCNFRVEYAGSVSPVNINDWLNQDIYTKPRWTDNLSAENPVLCWIMEDKTAVVLVTSKEGSFYFGANEGRYIYAEPVKLEDACIWEGE